MENGWRFLPEKYDGGGACDIGHVGFGLREFGILALSFASWEEKEEMGSSNGADMNCTAHVAARIRSLAAKIRSGGRDCWSLKIQVAVYAGSEKGTSMLFQRQISQH